MKAAGVMTAAALGVWLATGHHIPNLDPHPGHSGRPAANRALGDRMAAAEYGWAGSQRACLNVLWQGESGWRTSADTRATGLDPGGSPVYAYGIPQARPAQKMATAGPDWQTNPATQIRWGLGYIEHMYGTPCAALAFKRASGNKGY